MKRVLLLIALGVAPSALAQAPTPPVSMPRTLPPTGQSDPQSYTYAAKTTGPVRRAGMITAGGISWQCMGSSCSAAGPWPQPLVPACEALAHEVGTIALYGRIGALLSAAQLAQCNASALVPSSPFPAPTSTY
jgi:hypothetical protein